MVHVIVGLIKGKGNWMDMMKRDIDEISKKKLKEAKK